MFFFAEISQYLAFGAALCVLIWMILRRSKSTFGRHAGQHQPVVRTPRPEKKGNVGLIDAPADVVRWEVAMHDSARDMKAELDTKMVALQTLTRLAQTESERLEAAIAKARQLGLGAPRDVLEQIENYNLQEPASPAARPAVPPRLCQEIYQLADQGRSPAIISQTLGAPLGEVELALSLRV